MTKSMTAFARIESGNIAWEVRSVNHRYLDGSFKIPETCRAIEPALRNQLRKTLSRGKVDCMLRIDQDAGDNTELNIDTAKLQKLKTALKATAEIFDQAAEPDLLDLLRWPGILQDQAQDKDALESRIQSAFVEALTSLNDMRSREGEELRRILLEKLAELEVIVLAVRVESPKIMQRQKDKLEAKLAELKVDVDQPRLEQELVYLAQKSDIMEEIDRLDTHVAEVRNTLKQKGSVGRRLDFLMQELNREANTLSSKAVAANTSIQAVELKVLIEQMREQVQNIE